MSIDGVLRRGTIKKKRGNGRILRRKSVQIDLTTPRRSLAVPVINFHRAAPILLIILHYK